MARADSVGKDRDTKDTTSAADRASSGKGGYSGAGGMDSPSERGPGPGGKGGGSTTGGGSSYSGQGRGQDSPSEGGPGRGVSGSSASADRNGGEGSRYSGRGGLNSPGEVARAADGFGLNGSAAKSPDRPDNSNYAGPRGLGGLGGAYVGGPPLDTAREYQRAYETMNHAGVRSIGGLMSATEPPASMASFRQAEIASMDSYVGALREALLDTIAGPESAGRYNVGYGGKTFPSYVDHPRNPVTITSGPNKGQKSTAAGRYQFIEDTWDRYANKLGLKDFSPASQDEAAYALASDVYEAKTGRTLDLDLMSANPDVIAGIGKALNDTWTSMPGGIEQGISGKSFARSFDANKSSRLSGTPENQMDATASAVTVDPNVPALEPVDANVAAYRDYGKSRAAAPTAMPSWDARAQRFRDLYISPNYSLEQQGFTQAYADSVTPEVDRASPATTPAGTATTPAATQSSTAAPAGSSATATPAVTSGTPVQPNASTSTPAQPAQTQPETVTPNRQRGTGAQIAATGIDVLAGLAPGVGTAASVFNAGSALLGGRTIGERIVDDFLSGDNPGRAPTSREGDSLIQRDKLDGGASSDPASVPSADVEEKTRRFVRTYLKTPTEKWRASRGLMTAAG